MKKLLVSAALPAIALAACTGAARLPQLQPALSSAASTSVPVPPLPLAATRPALQRGIAVDFYTWPNAPVATIAEQEVAYIRKLGGNAVSISFPFYVHGTRSNTVYGTKATPSPASIATFARVAEKAKLYVSIRPLLDEASLHRSRVGWAPTRPRRWFASYTRWLLPYAQMAQRNHIPVLIAGTELDALSRSPYWNRLNRRMRTVYHGVLACSNNWDVRTFAGNCGRGDREMVDAYRPLKGNLAAAWVGYAKTLPAHTVISEMGIAAARGANHKPWVTHWPVAHLHQRMQVLWFTDACRAVRRAHLGGVYFWPVNFGNSLTSGPSLSKQTIWTGGAGARAIASCFSALRRVG